MRFEIEKPKNFDIEQIFDCGQCFRFSRTAGDGEGVSYSGAAFGRYIEITQHPDRIVFGGVAEEDFNGIWSDFFDLNTDYSKIAESFSDDPVLKKAAEYSSGIRILRQDKWETLCSFIISQNNNIPRIKGIIENMSKAYGKEIPGSGGRYYSFPTAQALYEAGEDAIFALKTGFRAKYIFDAAKTVCENPFFLTECSALDTEQASGHLQKIKGVGAKVAACTLLFGYKKYDAFPIDVWVKRILEKYYPDGRSRHLDGKYAGIAQQYLFYYERCMNNVFIK